MSDHLKEALFYYGNAMNEEPIEVVKIHALLSLAVDVRVIRTMMEQSQDAGVTPEVTPREAALLADAELGRVFMEQERLVKEAAVGREFRERRKRQLGGGTDE